MPDLRFARASGKLRTPIVLVWKTPTRYSQLQQPTQDKSRVCVSSLASRIQASRGSNAPRSSEAEIHKLFVVMAAESGLRSHVLMELRYRHVAEDLESWTIPVAVRLEPRFYVGNKAAGCTFLSERSVRLLRECVDEGLVEVTPHSKLIQRSYYGVWAAIHRAKRKAGLDPKIQPCHGFRKYFENALDQANIDHEKKMIIEGHFAGTRAKHYTDRDVEQLRDLYRRAYPVIRLNVDETVRPKAQDESYARRLAALEAQIARQRVLEAKLTVLEDELDQMRAFQRRLEKLPEIEPLVYSCVLSVRPTRLLPEYKVTSLGLPPREVLAGCLDSVGNLLKGRGKHHDSTLLWHSSPQLRPPAGSSGKGPEQILEGIHRLLVHSAEPSLEPRLVDQKCPHRPFRDSSPRTSPLFPLEESMKSSHD